MKGERVKSVEELIIANFLYLNGIEFLLMTFQFLIRTVVFQIRFVRTDEINFYVQK